MTTQDIQEEAVVMTTQDDAAIDAAPVSTDSAVDESTQAQDVLETTRIMNVETTLAHVEQATKIADLQTTNMADVVTTHAPDVATTQAEVVATTEGMSLGSKYAEVSV